MNPRNSTASQPTRNVLGFICAVGFILLYSWLYFASGLFEKTIPDGETIKESRGSFVLETLILPDQLWEVWRAFGTMTFGVTDRLPYVACAAAWLLIAWFIGRVALDSLRIRLCFHPVEQTGLAIAAGLNLLSLITLAIGLMGGSGSRWPIAVALVLLIGLAGVIGIRLRDHVARIARTRESIGYWDRRRVIFMAMACVLLSSFYVLGAVLPPFEFDVREYHLQAPKEFFQSGEIRFLAHNIYANMPMGTEMHALSWMSLWGGNDGWYQGALVGKVIFASYAIVTAMILGGCVARQSGPLAGWIVACVWLGTPGIAEVSKLGLIDQAVACYLAASIALLTAWQKNSAMEPAQQRSMLLLLGWFLGSAAACKYTSVPFIVLPSVAVALWFAGTSKQSTRFILTSLAILCVSGALAGGLWYGKNVVLTGNPVYPLAYGFFGGKSLTESKAQQWNQAHRVPVISAANADDLSSDYRLSTLTHEFRRIAFESPYLGLLIIPLSAIGLFVHRSQISFILALWFLWYLFILLLSFDRHT